MAKKVPYEKSFAYIKPWAVQYWSKDNELGPEEVTASSAKKFKFDFVTPNGIPYSSWYQLYNFILNAHSKFVPPCDRNNGRVFVPGYNDLLSVIPEATDQFVSYETKDGEIITDPSKVMFYNAVYVVRSCNKGHIWNSRLDHWKRGYGCPVCSGRIVGEGSFTAYDAYPELRDKWHPDNEKSLKELLPNSGTEIKITCGDHYYISCLNLYSYIMDCPVCSGYRVIEDGKNSLIYEFPELATEYHPDNAIPVGVLNKGSHLKVKWIHSCGHIWKATVNNRTRGGGCPVCVWSGGVSKIEKFVCDELSKKLKVLDTTKVNSYWSGSLNRFRVDMLFDNDLVVEYDGAYWHKNRIKKDTEKTLTLLNDGYRVVRIREFTKQISLPSLNIVNPNYLEIQYKYDTDYESSAKDLIDEVVEWYRSKSKSGDLTPD